MVGTLGLSVFAAKPLLALSGSVYADYAAGDMGDISDDELVNRLNVALRLPIPLVRMEPVDAYESFRFDEQARPANATIYVQHPIKPEHYIEATDYPARLIAEKHAAFKKLAAALGAQSVTLKSVRNAGKSAGLSSSLPIEELGATLGIGAKFTKDGAVSEVQSTTYARTIRAPYVPEELKSWVEVDTALDLMAHTRLQSHALSDHISISATSRHGVDAEVLARVMEKDISASAAFHAMSSSVWDFDVVYHDLSQ